IAQALMMTVEQLLATVFAQTLLESNGVNHVSEQERDQAGGVLLTEGQEFVCRSRCCTRLHGSMLNGRAA
ncbi:MAG TPA: hypothetical protein P5534_12245, partial [Candidatus Paceibacterota bacterium]|nr:hypothetical protein [Candidatus Paceibacterota bacterium]